MKNVIGKTLGILALLLMSACQPASDSGLILSDAQKRMGEEIAEKWNCQEYAVELAWYDDSVCDNQTEGVCPWEVVYGPKAYVCNGYEPSGYTISALKSAIESCGLTAELRYVDQNQDPMENEAAENFSTDFLLVNGYTLGRKEGSDQLVNYGGNILIRHKDGISLEGCQLN